MSRTRYEWTLIDFAIWSAGAVTVPIYETSSAEQVQWILSDSGAGRVRRRDRRARGPSSPRSATDLPTLEHVWAIDDGALDDLRDAGTRRRRRRARGPRARVQRRRPGHDHLHLRHDRAAPRAAS